MIYELDPNHVGFPNPEEAEPDGLIAIGGDLSPQRLLEAYCSGIFPWFNEGEPILWFSLDPRMVMPVADFHPHKSLQRVVRSGKFECRIDTCFEQVMRLCGSTRADKEGTWVTDDLVRAYVELHRLGVAHSFETYCDGQLVGGLFGESIGDWFFGESMFHLVTDASKVAFCHLVDYCRLHGLRMIDAQQETAHLHSLGARPIPRKDYLAQIHSMPQEKSLIHRWGPHTVVLLLGSNLGNRQALLANATREIAARIGTLSRQSALYETAPWGDFGTHQPQPFLNQALIVDTPLPPEEVLRLALQIEAQLGRTRQEGIDTYMSRPIDIDLIFYDKAVINTPALILPHPRAHLRRFVLEPLCELIPNYIHPTLHRPIRQLLSDCPE